MVYFAKVIVDTGAAQSVSAARRLIDEGAVRVNGEALAAKSYNLSPESLKGAEVQVGKKKFFKLA